MTLPLELTVDESIAHLTFNRPEALNAIDLATAEAFEAAVTRVLATPAVRVLLLSGQGRAFMAGGDLAAFHAADNPASAVDAIIAPMHRALEALAGSDLLVVALVQGAAAGAGLSLTLAADFAIAADSAVFSFAYLRIGAPADCGITWTLPRIVGLRRALWLAIEGSAVKAEAALAMGLVNEVVPAGDLAARGEALARRLATTAPGAAGDLKRLLRTGLDVDFAHALESERQGFVRAAGTKDFREAISAFFEKRPAKFTGR